MGRRMPNPSFNNPRPAGGRSYLFPFDEPPGLTKPTKLLVCTKCLMSWPVGISVSEEDFICKACRLCLEQTSRLYGSCESCIKHHRQPKRD